jgi:hypothetical protein
MASAPEQQSGLHLIDLIKAYPREPGAHQALAALEDYRLRGAEARRKDENRKADAVENRPTTKAREARLAVARIAEDRVAAEFRQAEARLAAELEATLTKEREGAKKVTAAGTAH